MGVDGDNAAELLFTPAIDRDTHALFLRQIAETDPEALHVIIQDQAGLPLPTNDSRLPPNLRLLPLPPFCPELNPVERLGNLIKARVRNRPYPTLARIERHIEAVAQQCLQPARVASLTHDWLLDQVNDGVPA